MAIRVSGQAVLKVSFDVELDMTESEFESLPERKQDDLIDSAINWGNVMGSAEVDEFDVWEYGEVEV